MSIQEEDPDSRLEQTVPRLRARAVWARIFGYSKGMKVVFIYDADLKDRILLGEKIGELYKGDRAVIIDKIDRDSYWLKLTDCRMRRLRGKLIRADEKGFVLDTSKQSWNPFHWRRKRELENDHEV